MPPAPPTFSMITRWPNTSPRRAARMRPMMSTAPPAANGITMVSGRSGQLCARAGALAAARTTRAANMQALNGGLLDFMGTSAACTVVFKDRRSGPRPQVWLEIAIRYVPWWRFDPSRDPQDPHDSMTHRAMIAFGDATFGCPLK